MMGTGTKTEDCSKVDRGGGVTASEKRGESQRWIYKLVAAAFGH